MPYKYNILSSHADAKASKGRKVSDYPPKRKGSSSSKPKMAKKSKKY